MERENRPMVRTILYLVDVGPSRGVGGEAPAEEVVGGGREVERLDEMVVLVRAVGGIAGVGGVRDGPGCGAGDECEEDHGEGP
jgi:hypothetical protein